jgi:hypothetical protein
LDFFFLSPFTFQLSQLISLTIFSKLGTMGSFVVANLSLFEVNHIPDRSEVLLIDYVSFHTTRNRDKTDVNFDVLVLEVEGMLPNINADDGVMS